MRRFAGPCALAALAACAHAPDPALSPVPTRDRLAWVVDSAVASGAVPGAVVGISIDGESWFHGSGHLGFGPAYSAIPDRRSVYDLASVTKIVALTTLAMEAVAEGRLALDTRVVDRLPAFQGPWKDQVTLRHLLTHTSGLPAGRPLYEEAPTRDSALALVLGTPLDTVPGVRVRYSDLGAILAGLMVEQAFGVSLDTLVAARVSGPLRLRETAYRPPASWGPRIAPTELDPWRGRILHGEVHDENASRLGGVSAHAGLFSSAEDLVRFGEWWLAEATASDTLPRERAARLFVQRQDVVPGSSRALGWDTPSDGSSAGTRLANWSFGHTGFTGTSIWVDPSRRLVVVLLTNRVHPTRQNFRHAPLRRAVADLAAGIVDRERGAR